MAAAQLVGQQPPPGGISAAAAGGEPRKKKKARMMKPRPSLEPGLGGGDAESEHAGNSKLARALGSCDFHTRERGVAALTRFLQRRTGGLPRKDMLKIWKGLFYAFWHSDKQPVQAELAERLAKVMASLHEEVAYVYFTCFIKTMRREWFGIDRLRLDKFLMLIRTFVRQMFVTLRSREWDPVELKRYSDFFSSSVLLPSDTQRAAGVSYHLSDLWLPELRAACAAGSRAGSGGHAAEAGPTVTESSALPPHAALDLLLQPFVDVLHRCKDAPLLARVREGVFDVLVQEVRAPSEGAPLRHLDAPALAAHLFGLGAGSDVLARCREALYAVSEALERAHAKRQRLDAKAAAVAQAPEAGEPSTGAPPVSAEGGLGSVTKAKKRKASSSADNGGGAATSAAATPTATASGTPSRKEASTSAPASGAGGTKKASTSAPASGAGGTKKARLSVGSAPTPVPASGGGKKARISAGAAAVGGREEDALGGTPHPEPRALASARPSALKKKPLAAAPAAAPSTAKKRVKINLKQNLYFEFGGPVPPADVRTPQSARPKGGILKTSGVPGSAPAKVGGSRLAPVDRPLSHSADKASRPAAARDKASPRAKATLFF